MHSVTDKQTDGKQDYANSRSYRVAVRSAKNINKRKFSTFDVFKFKKPLKT